jgi:hypothetical protein
VTLWSTEDAAGAFQRVAEGHPLQVEFEHALEAGSFHLDRYATLD